MCIKPFLFDCLLEILVFSGRLGSYVVGLGVIFVESLLACKSCPFKDGNLLLEQRLGPVGNLHDMFPVLGVNHEYVVERGSHHSLHSRYHVCLGHPAYVSPFSHIRILVGRIEGSYIGEGLASALEHIHKTVCQCLLVALEKDVLNEHGIRNHSGFHHLGNIECVVLGEYLRSALTVIEHEVIDI